MTNNGEVWFRRFRPVPQPRLRLVCLPHAGGGASAFRYWADKLPADVELLAVRYPGRQDRLLEPCVDQMAPLADAITEAMLPLFDRPVAIFGHSMGASVGFEVTHRLERRYGRHPVLLFVSGQQPPAKFVQTTAYAGDDAALVAEVDRLGGTGAEFLRDPDMRELLLPAIRADFTLVGTYRPDRSLSVGTPIVAYVGDRDCDVTVEENAAWADATTGPAEHHVLPGDHFFLIEREDELVAHVVSRLENVGIPVAG